MNTTELVVKIRPEKQIQARTGFEPLIFAIPVQTATNEANEPTGSWLVRSENPRLRSAASHSYLKMWWSRSGWYSRFLYMKHSVSVVNWL